MRTATSNLQDVAAEWRHARRVYSVYAAIVKSTGMTAAQCKALESPVDRADEESLNEVRAWLGEMDGKTMAAQIRQILQNSSLGTEECLRSLIQRYLGRSERTSEDRSKLDFLMVQYLAQTAPRHVILGLATTEDVASVLEPVLGESPLELPRQLEPLKALIDHIEACRSLEQLIREGVLESGRKLKEQAGEMYFASSVLVAFARYNFLLRRAFVRMLHADLEVIRTGLNDLESHGTKTVNCAAAGFGASEPISDLRGYCKTWRNTFVGDYAAGPSFKSIAEVRKAVEAAVQAQKEHKVAKVEAAVKAASPGKAVKAETKPTPAKASAVAARSVSSEVAAIEDARARVNAAVKQAAMDGQVSFADKVERLKTEIRRQLAAKQHKGPGLSVTVGSTTMVVSAWEMKAFANPQDDCSATLERSVVARLMLKEGIDKKMKLDAGETKPLMQLAQEIAAELQDKIARARSGQQLEPAVNMAASAKMLQTLREEAARWLSESK
jgi:hypothetical protein